jgi:two-component system chemotaxis sensor kinase CheA
MPSNMVRVDLSRLDELMRIVGEMVISRARLEDNLDRVEQATATDDWRTFQEINQAMERQLRTLREAVMRVRMVPIGEVFVRLQFAALDVARNDRKEVRLEISGSETELDKFMVERMMDPLLHLVRNAVSHGLEQPDDRVALGKEPAGQLRLAAHTAGDTVVITIGDDGRGMALPPIERRARAMGLLSQDQQLDPNHILEMLCAPGFSTRETADLASGRGVGMTVVQQTVQELAGTLHLETVPDQGSTFTIHLPLTLAITDALIVTVAGQRFAVPLQVIHEVVQLEMAKVKRTEKRELMPYREGVLPLIRVRQVFHLDSAPAPDERDAPRDERDAPRDERDAPRGERGVVLVVGRNRQRVGLVVDRILSQREIVVRALADPLVRSAGLAGATELGDGQVVLILDTAALAAPSSTARRK